MKSFFRLPLAAIPVLAFSLSFAHAQTLTPGKVTTPVNQVSCPSGQGISSTATCWQSTVNCNIVANIPSISFTYVLTPVPTGITQNGTIVFFNGGDGNTLGFNNYITNYINAGFQTIQVVWGSAWEQLGTGTTPWNIKYAACRPAGLLKYLFQTYEQSPRGAMCAQGDSAGSAAIAYSLAEYSGTAGYLDHAELVSGPPLSKIGEGCNPSSYESVTVCPGSACQTGGEGSWMDPSEYEFNAPAAIDGWAGFSSSTCTASNNSGWQAISIVDGMSDSGFSYPQTGMTGWICSGGTLTQQCKNTTPAQNNSAAEGQFFFSEVSALNGTPPTVYRVDNCTNSVGEGVDGGYVPALSCEEGITAVGNDMTSKCAVNH